jgi:hypothetical protein
MPLTTKGKKILHAMQAEYGAEKGERVFYASANKGRIRGVHRSPSSYNDTESVNGPVRATHNASQVLPAESAPGGTDAGGTEDRGSNPTTKQAGNPRQGSGSRTKWPAGVDTYSDAGV